MDELLSLIRARVEAGLPITATTALISSGIIDSFAVAALVAELETRFEVTIDGGDIGVDNFDTPAQMLAFIDARR
jgi:acyl carrier protein